jgi:predicted DNA-binding transcriptional regulator
MYIIPHNRRNVQVEIEGNTDQIQTIWNTNQILMSGLSEIQREAYSLYDAGFNVIPQPTCKKGGYAWRNAQFSRLNRNDEAHGIRTLFAGQCNIAVMCGRTSGNLFVIDCESRGAFLYHTNKLRERNIPLWITKTARGGHIYLQATDGEVQNIKSGILHEAEIRGCNGYVLAPPSIHPTGAVYQWIVREGEKPPQVSSKQINWLQDEIGKNIELEVTPIPKTRRGTWSMRMVSPASKLSNSTRDYIRSGFSISEGTRNNRLFSAACDLNGCGYSHSEAEHILTSVATMGGLPLPEVKATIKSAYSQTRESARPNTSKIIMNNTWRYALLWASQHQWAGRTNATDRALFLALIERSRVGSNENDVFRASIRELGELARIGTETVQKALLRLKDMNTIISCGYDSKSRASLWRFTDKIINIAKELELNSDTVKIPPHWLSYSVSLFNSDISERGALGRSVNFVYQYMLTEKKAMMPSEISDFLGITANQVNYAVYKLKSSGLIHRLPNGWSLIEMTIEEVEAVFEHVRGKGEARAERFRRERQFRMAYFLSEARYRAEGDAYLRPLSDQFEWFSCVQELLVDPVVAMGVELGGVVALPFNSCLSTEGVTWLN